MQINFQADEGEVKDKMERRELEERMTRLEKNFEDYNIYWRERVAYISIIVGLIVALIMVVIALV